MKRILIATPWFGEFGWQLMRWQGYLRKLSRQYDETMVMAKPEDFYLYKDFAVKNIAGIPDMWTMRDTEIQYVNPGIFLKQEDIAQEFIKYGKPLVWSKTRIVIHARNDSREVLGDRNWPRERWNLLIKTILFSFKNVSIYAIGTFEGAMGLDNTRDNRGESLENIADLLASSGMCIGPSSGPMHFASLCGCPQVVWSDDATWRVGNVKATNRERYETIWNPLNTQVHFFDHEGWRPSVETVFGKVKEILPA